MENDFKNEGRAKALIPARLGSMRLPNKALLDIQGLPMIIDVYRRLFYSRLLSNVFVVTDSDEIQEVVLWHGGECIYRRIKMKATKIELQSMRQRLTQTLLRRFKVTKHWSIHHA